MQQLCSICCNIACSIFCSISCFTSCDIFGNISRNIFFGGSNAKRRKWGHLWLKQPSSKHEFLWMGLFSLIFEVPEAPKVAPWHSYTSSPLGDGEALLRGVLIGFRDYHNSAIRFSLLARPPKEAVSNLNDLPCCLVRLKKRGRTGVQPVSSLIGLVPEKNNIETQPISCCM